MAKKKLVEKLNKPYYVMDEYGHNDAMLVRKINELINIVNRQEAVIRDFEIMMKNRR